ncbi:MAG: hypothetical protein M9913_11575 [Bryobacteraceae bacterium]|jgi:hypothetical protein|nr:hypothetical protein [Solibacteraceae bacterium]MCL4844505.1 hypothetical protein [Bryobacteraceae bacterium]MCO5351514.1 hypothetical protein [Bryobacteraceae bacterium]HAX43727.1 hypothetical protein [Bryobacterales bacterium]HRJ20520.1 hypothetical protein [Bryobacteraceae bacterium]
MEETPTTQPETAKAREKSGDEIALELMKFISSTTGYAKGAQAVGFSGKGPRTPEEQADALLALFERCRQVVRGGE